jgi:TolB-like protein
LPGTSGDRLDSWKEIAAYLNRGVRTVRRWERDERLPVHRHVHRTLGSVYAYKSEIELWRRSEARAGREPSAADPGAASAGADTTSIAVLPFSNLSTDPENAYFADGLTEEITVSLSKVRTLRVISRTSSMTFKDTSKDVTAIARDLAVRYVLAGSVRRAGTRLRISAQLIDAGTDSHLWADTFDGTVDDIFAFQERLARVIVDALRVRLTEDEERRLADRPIDNVVAYDCYLRARQEAWRWRKDAIDHAIQLLRNGLAIVGDNGRLYAALGLAYLQYREAGLDFSDQPLQEAELCAREVIRLEPDAASGWLLRGWMHYARGRIQLAVFDLKHALVIDPNNADTLLMLSNCYLISGQVSVARPLIDRLLAIDPLTPLSRCMPAWADALDGHFAAALEPYRQMFEMDPANPMARLFYVWILALNEHDATIGLVVDGFAPDVRATVPARLASFLACAVAGDKRGAQATVTAELEAVATAADVFSRLLAQGYARVGLPDEAIYWLGVSVERGFINYPFLARIDPFLVPLRTDARFLQLMHTVRARWEAFSS